MGKISKLFNRFSKQQSSFAETGTNEQHRVDDEHEKEENKVKESNSSIHEEEVTKKEEKKKSDGKAHIYNLIIVDESGSMSHLREVTLSGINETIGTIRNAQKEFAQTQVHTLTLVTFDTDSNRPAVRTMIDNQPIANVKKFRDYMPNGCTPLYDAMGQSLTRLHTLIKGDVDASAVVTVLTDGLENASREWNAQSLRKLIEQLKQEGWSFSYMGSAHDVKEVTDLLSIENVVEFSHDQLGAGNTWGRERSSRRAYYQKMSDTYSMRETLSDEEIMAEKRRYAKEYYGPRVTPQMIRQLGENEIFVFGSNANGYHRGGAAAFAMREFGAVWGQGEGLQGKSYAIPTMEGLDQLREAVNRFTAFADQHQELRFLVTMVGCGIAGYSPRDIAPLFKGCIDLENVALPIEFWNVLGLKMGF
jgi:Mg-chelatase subunit ChlD